MRDKIRYALNNTVMFILLLVVLIAPIVLTSVIGYAILTVLTSMLGETLAMAVFLVIVSAVVIISIKEEKQ